MPRRVGALPQRLAWEIRRGLRRLHTRVGAAWLAAAFAALLLAGAGWLREDALDRWRRADASSRAAQRPTPTPAAAEPDARARLREFDALLLPHDDIPSVLQDLIALAESQGLLLARGSYRAEPDLQGGYLRYRMTLPVSGPADAVQRFMLAALHERTTLSLDSVQFKRERRDTGIVEARIQWSLLTRLPAAARPGSRRAGDAP